MRRTTRRRFLAATGKAIAAAAAFPSAVRAAAARGSGSVAPSDRLTMGAIGVGGMGTHDLRSFLAQPDLRVLAACDVDAGRLEAAKRLIDGAYGTTDCAAYNDFRDILGRDDIDTILVATPDHWHAFIAIEAAKAGKDMYCEKPISVTVAEGRAVADAVKRYGIVYQSGTQRRSIPCFAFAVEVARSGKIGRLRALHTNLSRGLEAGIEPPQPVPPGFDYERWLGPAPFEPYTPRRCHGSFRWIYDYSGGQLTDIGAHFVDLAQWGNDSETTAPIEFAGRAEFPKDGLFNTPVAYEVVAKYASGVELILHDTDPRAVKFEGTGGWVSVDDSGLVLAEPRSILEGQTFAREDYSVMAGHHRNFLACVKTRALPIANAEVAHCSTTICHVANICLRLGRKIRWDPARERFVEDPEADRMLSRAARAPWHL